MAFFGYGSLVNLSSARRTLSDELLRTRRLLLRSSGFAAGFFGFCRTLSAQEGKEYRLPTEAEWEYACHAGTSTTETMRSYLKTGFGLKPEEPW